MTFGDQLLKALMQTFGGLAIEELEYNETTGKISFFVLDEEDSDYVYIEGEMVQEAQTLLCAKSFRVGHSLDNAENELALWFDGVNFEILKGALEAMFK